MTIQHPSAAETPDREHLIEWMGKCVSQHKIIAELVTHLTRGGGVRLVETERHFKLFESGPERLIVRLLPVPSVDDISAQKYRPKFELLDAALSFVDGIGNVEDGNHSGADEFGSIRLAKIV